MSTPYMSVFQEQTLFLFAMSAACLGTPLTGVFWATAWRGMPRMRCTPNLSPLPCT